MVQHFAVSVQVRFNPFTSFHQLLRLNCALFLTVPHRRAVNKLEKRLERILNGLERRKAEQSRRERVISAYTRDDGQMSFSGQISQRGARATQIARPCSISRCDTIVHCSDGKSGIRSSSIFTASVSRVSPSRSERRVTCVSTTIPTFLLKAFPRITFAVLRPTPGSSVSSSIVSGTLPPCWATSACAMPSRLFVLLRKKPVLLISVSSSSRSASAICVALG